MNGHDVISAIEKSVLPGGAEISSGSDSGGCSLVLTALKTELALELAGGVGLTLAAGDDSYVAMYADTLLVCGIARLGFTGLELVNPAEGFTDGIGGVFVDGLVGLNLQDGICLSACSVDVLPVYLGKTGCTLTASGVAFGVAGAGDAAPSALVTIAEATLTFPPDLQGFLPETATLKNATIGTGGFSGSLYLKYDNPTPKYENGKYIGKDGIGSIFGMAFAVGEIDINIKQNAFVSNSITGTMRIPFFDIDAKVALGLRSDGGYLLKYFPDPKSNKVATPFADITIDSFGIQGKGTEARVMVAGTITPTVANDLIDWPTMVVKDLSIDRHGNVHFAGGWVDLDKPRTIGIGGVGFEISKMGMGRDPDNCPWFGLNGALKLPEGVPASGSVEGLKVRPTWSGQLKDWDWKQPRIDFAGIGVEFEIPEVLHFAGHVAYHKSADGEDFRGGITLDLYALDMTIEGVIVFGKKDQTPYFAIYLSADLPSPIPLFGSNLAIYGLSGLVAVNYGPNRTESQPWYALDHNDWYHANPTGVVDLVKKWEPKPAGTFALGVGAELATMNDKGYAFNGTFIAVVCMPGPVILLEGVANILRERPTKADKDGSGKPPPKPPEPMFHALAALDCNAGNLTFGLDAQWRYRDDGQLLDISGSSEIFVDFHDAAKFHIWLGKKDPEAQRVRAKILSLFEANAYLMLDKNGVQTGAKAGFSKSWSYKVGGVGIDVGASIHLSSDVSMSWNPPQFHGDATMAGEAHILLCGEGLSMSLASSLAVDVPQPFRVAGDLAVSCHVWPFGTFAKTVHLQWTAPQGQPLPADPNANAKLPPPPVLPLTDVTVRHSLTGETWPLLRGSNLLPDGLSDARGFLVTPVPAGAVPAAPANGVPVVPLDACIDLCFARPVADKCNVGIGAAIVEPLIVGDPSSKTATDKLGYELVAIELLRLTDNKVVAKRPWKAGDDGVPLWGSWAEAEGAESVNRRLRLWGVDPKAMNSSISMEWLPPPAESGKVLPRPAGASLVAAPAHVLDADSVWRLKIQTQYVETFAEPTGKPPKPDGSDTKTTTQPIDQYAFFCTQSGPGRANLSVPPAGLGSDVLVDLSGSKIDVLGNKSDPMATPPIPIAKASALNGLAPYLLRQVPSATADSDGPNAQWRDASVGLDFVSGVVPKLYAGRKQSLGVRLFDRTGHRWSDEQGLPIVGRSQWLEAKNFMDNSTTAAVQSFLSQLQAAGAVVALSDLYGTRLRGNSTLLPSTADLLVQVAPALIAEPFGAPAGAAGKPWSVLTDKNAGGAADWQIAADGDQPAALRQKGTLTTPVGAMSQALRPGSALFWSSATSDTGKWQNIAVLVRLRPGATGAVGVDVRRTDSSHFVRVEFDNDLCRWRIVRAAGAMTTVLAERQARLAPLQWHPVRVDVMGDGIKVVVAGQVVFDVTVTSPNSSVTTPKSGTVALFAAGGGVPAFADLWVEELDQVARPQWQTTLLTHAFASPLHLAAFAPPTARDPNPPVGQISVDDLNNALKLLKVGVPTKTAGAGLPSVAEDLATTQLLKLLTASCDVLKAPTQSIDLVRLALSGLPPVVVVRTAVNIDWRRSTVAVYERSQVGFLPRFQAGPIRLLGGAWPTGSNASLSAVDLIARERYDLRGAVVVAESFAGPDVGDPPPLPTLDTATLDAKRSGRLYAEDFAPFALDRWQLVPTSQSAWSVSASKLSGAAPSNSDVLLLQPNAAAADVTTATQFTLNQGCLGLVFRDNGAGGNYRVECDGAAQQLRIIDQPSVGSAVTLASIPAPSLTIGSQHWLQVWCNSGDVVALLDGQIAASAAGLGQRGTGLGLWLKARAHADITQFVAQTRENPLQPKGPLSTPVDQWQVVDLLAPNSPPSSWSRTNPGPTPAGSLGVAQSASVIVATSSTGPSPAASQVVLPCGQPDAYLWLARVKFAQGAAAGLGFGWNGSAAPRSLRCDASGWRLCDAAGKSLLSTGSTSAPLLPNVWHTVCVTLVDLRLTIWLDGNIIVDQQVGMTLSGGLTFQAISGASAFEHVLLLDPRARCSNWTQTTILNSNVSWPVSAPLQPALWMQDDLGIALCRVAHVLPGAGRSVLLGDQSMSDIDLCATVQSDGLPFGFVFRWQDAQNYCVAWIDTKEITAIRFDEGAAIALSKPLPHTLSLGQAELSARVTVVGDQGTFAVGALTLKFTESRHASGRCGWGADAASQTSISRFTLAPAVADQWLPTTTLAGAIWNANDATGAKEGPSKWKLGLDGSISQTSNIFGGPDTPSDLTRPGTVFLLASPNTPDDFIFRCEICGGKEPDIGDALGVVFRWRSPSVFYRFSMDCERKYRRLVKVINGVATELWGDTVSYEEDRWYRLVITARGPDLRCWLDGTPLFAVRDNSIGSGQVGLYTWAQSNAHFKGIRLKPNPYSDTAVLAEASLLDGADAKLTVAPGPAWTTSAEGLALKAVSDSECAIGDPTWSTLRCSVMVRRDNLLGTLGLAVGCGEKQRLLARFTAKGGLEVAVQSKGTSTDAWSDSSSPLYLGPCLLAQGQWQMLTLDLVDGMLAVWLAGKRMCRLAVPALAGRVALFGTGGAGVTWRQLRVEKLRQQRLARLLMRLHEGQRVRVTTDAAAIASEEGQVGGVICVPASANLGSWPTDGPVRLSVLSRDGSSLHAMWADRKVADDQSVPCTVLRSRDGRTAIMSPAVSTSVLPAPRFLRWIWRSEVPTTEPVHQVVELNGVDGDQVVDIDL